jgi:hypothetical protein
MSTPLLGLGIAPFGTSLLGIGANAVSDAPGTDTLLTDSRQQGTCRKLNPNTKSYDFDISGNMLGMTTAQQLVELALTDSRNFLIKSKVITSNLAVETEASIRTALSDLTDGGIITINQIKTTIIGTRLLVNILWTDNVTNTDQLTNL